MLNNYLTPTAKKDNFNLFDQLNRSVKILKREKYTFHDLIKKEKNDILKMYYKDFYFKAMISDLNKSQKGVAFYNAMFRKAMSKQNYIMNIINRIRMKKNLNKENLTLKKTKNYELEEVELMKRKKINIEKKYKLLKNPLLVKNNSFITNSPRINDSLEKPEGDIFNKSLNMKLYKIKIKHFNNKHSKSFTTRSKETKIMNLNSLIYKCLLGINKGNNLEKKVENFFKKQKKEDKKYIKDDNNISMVQMLSDKKMKLDEMSSNEKFKRLEELKLNELKKEMNLKISDLLAYSNRDEYTKKINNPDISCAYDLYLQDIKSIIKDNSLKRKIEKDNISQIKSLLEDYQIGKELLKQKIKKFKDSCNNSKNLINKSFEGAKDYGNFEKLKNYLKNKKKIDVIDKLI